MSTWVGPLGGLVPVRTSVGISPHIERSVNLRTTLGGAQKAQLAVRTVRTRAHTLSFTRPEDVAALEALISGEYGLGPFHWVDPWAQQTNLLTPAASTLAPGTWRSASGVSTASGSKALTGGGIAGRSITLGSSAAVTYFPARNSLVDPVAVIPGIPVTGSAFASGATVSAVLRWLDASGASQGSVANSVTASGTPRRVSVTGTPPAGAVSVRLEVSGADVIARPAITWTPAVMPWRSGQGMPRVIITALDSEVQIAAPVQGATYSFSVVEVG